jgi:transposase
MAGKTHQVQRIKDDVLVVGIDIAKRGHMAVCRRPDGRRSKAFFFGNDRSGFEKLIDRSEATKQHSGCRSVLFALEATGHYGQALRQFLAEREYGVVGINPAHTKKVKELDDNSPEKSDSKDAGVIADLAANGRGRLIVLPSGVFADLRRLGKLRERLVRDRTRVCNRYHGLIDLVFPELAGIVRNVACRSIQRLFAECPTVKAIAALSHAELDSRLSRWSRRRLERDRIAAIYRAAKTTVGLREGLAAVRLELRQTLESLQQLNHRMGEVEQAQKIALHSVSYADLLLSIPNLGPITVATVLGETGDLRMYRNADAVIKFAGYNLYTMSSGTFRGKTRITKRGRPLLRRYLFLAALRLSRKQAPLRGFHQRMAGRKAGPQIAVAGARKLLRLMVALVRDEMPYEAGRLAVELKTASAA